MIDPRAFVVVWGSCSILMASLYQMFWLWLLIFFYDLMIGPQAQMMLVTWERICEHEGGNLLCFDVDNVPDADIHIVKISLIIFEQVTLHACLFMSRESHKLNMITTLSH